MQQEMRRGSLRGRTTRIHRVNYCFRVNKDLKDEFDAFCDTTGISPSNAINIFLRAVMRDGCMPFDVAFEREIPPETQHCADRPPLTEYESRFREAVRVPSGLDCLL